MTSRRPNASEKTAPAAPESSQATVPKSVVAKLLGFTFAMVTVPIGSYFLTVDTIFKGTLRSPHPCLPLFLTPANAYPLGNSSLAGGLAALLANVVLVGYVIAAMNEDQKDLRTGKIEETKKDI